MQMFCGIQLLVNEQIKDKDIVGRWRSYLGKYLDADKMQISCVQHWKPLMDGTHVGFCDATVYESYIEYPTDSKLLWKSCCDVLEMIKLSRKKGNLRTTRINHEKRKTQYLSFAKRRKKSKRLSRKTCKWLLKYLQRLIEQLGNLLQKHTIGLSASQVNRLSVINKLKEQQWQLHFGKEVKVPGRIVSLHKPYVRAIIRGKEVKPVEFGVKVNMLQVDGISFIEHWSYDNFNEGARLQSTIHLQQRYFGVCHQIGADAIYATNANRKYCTENKIATSFVAKGNEGKTRNKKARCNEKNHYQMNKIKARTQDNEKAWIFFSLLACNAMQIAKRMQLNSEEPAQKQLRLIA